jgi:hypothetical protein
MAALAEKGKVANVKNNKKRGFPFLILVHRNIVPKVNLAMNYLARIIYNSA